MSFRQCLTWTEIAFHEAVRGDAEGRKSQRFVNLVENLACCLDELGDDFGFMNKATRSRLAQDLLSVCLLQVTAQLFLCIDRAVPILDSWEGFYFCIFLALKFL